MKTILRPFVLLPVALLLNPAHAQYTTPGTGQSYGLSELVDISGGVFTATSGTSYLQNADFTLAATDTLLITADVTWALAASASINIAGSFIAAPVDQLYITSEVAGQPHQGMRFEDSSSVYLQRTSILEGGGIKCLTGNLILSHCTISGQVSNATTGAALELSRGQAIIDHVDFLNNEAAAISSAANLSAAPQISHCNFLYNGFANQNRPQINLGPSGADTTRILNNIVTGDPANTMAGGIAFSSLLGVEGHVVIDSNTVVDNRYGIAVTGSSVSSLISNNIITDNNTQGDPNLGGSGINLNGGITNVSMVSGNQISGNLWGITLQNAVMTNLGDTVEASFNPGGNSFAGNGNGGVIYALYNNTPNAVPAMNNCWDYETADMDSAAVATVIFDSADDNSLGPVYFMPFSPCDITTGIGSPSAEDALTIYPNPSSGEVTIRSEQPLEQYALCNAKGQLVRSGQGPLDRTLVLHDLRTGPYLLRADGQGVNYVGKIVVE
ncbi:MAG: T9SS type A sorting domain-containing protein [Flavobacteriales bacterium]|nr:T9SS type A sorting domain-containing protein [Flavobacteriales bacterium]